ncbi:MAG: hypothetical protein L7S52_07000 [Flavobacteriaceae bacterium]|nr:hypothetical protein [Flavobacteriaceae bacterium]
MKNKPFIPAPPPLLLLIFLTLHFTVAAQSNLSKNNVAVSGFDVVSYHKNKAIEGNVNYKVNHKGAVYLFDNEAHKSTFEANPKKFIPQYGGWCAYAMGNNGKKVAINPEAFTIEDGKLYLFYKTLFTDTQEKWMDNTAILKPKADLNWKKIKTQ